MITATLQTQVNECSGRCVALCHCDPIPVLVTITGTAPNLEDAEAITVTSATLDGEPFRLSRAEEATACEELFAVAVETERANAVCAATWAALREHA